MFRLKLDEYRRKLVDFATCRLCLIYLFLYICLFISPVKITKEMGVCSDIRPEFFFCYFILWFFEVEFRRIWPWPRQPKHKFSKIFICLISFLFFCVSFTNPNVLTQSTKIYSVADCIELLQAHIGRLPELWRGRFRNGYQPVRIESALNSTGQLFNEQPIAFHRPPANTPL